MEENVSFSMSMGLDIDECYINVLIQVCPEEMTTDELKEVQKQQCMRLLQEH